jgi:hypothetical protein
VNHLTTNRPSWQTIVDKQRAAQHRLTHSRTTRSAPEIAHYHRTLHAVPLADVELAKLPLVRVPGEAAHYALLGEVAQLPGMVLLLDIANGSINVRLTTAQLELLSPADLDRVD